MYNGITLNDVPFETFMKYLNAKNYGDIINTPVFTQQQTKMNYYSNIYTGTGRNKTYIPIPYDLEKHLLLYLKSKEKKDLYFVLNVLKLYGFDTTLIPGLYNNGEIDYDLDTLTGLRNAQDVVRTWLTADNSETAPRGWEEGHRLGDRKHDDIMKPCYIMPVPLTENMDAISLFVRHRVGEGIYQNVMSIAEATKEKPDALHIPSQQFKTYLSKICYRIRIYDCGENGKLYFNEYNGDTLEYLNTFAEPVLNIAKKLSTLEPCIDIGGGNLVPCDLTDKYRKLLLPTMDIFPNYQTQVVYIPTGLDIHRFVPDNAQAGTSSVTRQFLLTDDVLTEYGGYLYIFVTCNEMQVPEYTADGDNVYIDSTGMRTTKASYSNTFLTHQAAVRAAFNKMVANDNWMYRLPEGRLSLIQVGNKSQLRAYSRYCISTQYKLIDSLPEGAIEENNIIPYKIIQNLSKDRYTEIKNETFKTEFKYDYLEDYPQYKCYVDDMADIPIAGDELYCPQLENEADMTMGRDVVLNFYTRYLYPTLDKGTRLKVSKDGKIIFQFCRSYLPMTGLTTATFRMTDISTIECTLFDAGTDHPYLLLGIASNKDTLIKYLNSYLSFKFNDKWYSGMIQGDRLQIASAKVSFPALSKEPLPFYLGSELGFSNEEIEDYFGSDISTVFFLKIPLGKIQEEALASYICSITGSDGTIKGGSQW